MSLNNLPLLLQLIPLLLTLPYYFILSYSNHGAMLLNTGKKRKRKKNSAVFTTGQLSRAPEIQPK